MTASTAENEKPAPTEATFSRGALNVELYRRTRRQNVIGQTVAAVAMVALTWPFSHHAAVVTFLLVHQVATWTMVATTIVGLRNPLCSKLPPTVFVGALLPPAALGSLMFIDREALVNTEYLLSIGIVLYATAAGSVLRRGPLRSLARLTLLTLLVPFTVAALIADHVGIAMATVGFLAVVAGGGVGQVSKLYDELVDLRIAATVRASTAEADATTDALTGLANRNGLQLLDGSPVDLAIAFFLDLDGFKEINDTYGHAAGDQVLRVVSERIVNSMRVEDIVARLGGDEFVVVISAEPDRPVELIAERLLEQLGRPIHIEGDLVVATASVGVVVHHGPELDLDLLLAKSDEAMYRAKALGRGGLVIAQLGSRGDEALLRRDATIDHCAVQPPSTVTV